MIRVVAPRCPVAWELHREMRSLGFYWNPRRGWVREVEEERFESLALTVLELSHGALPLLKSDEAYAAGNRWPPLRKATREDEERALEALDLSREAFDFCYDRMIDLIHRWRDIPDLERRAIIVSCAKRLDPNFKAPVYEWSEQDADDYYRGWAAKVLREGPGISDKNLDFLRLSINQPRPLTPKETRHIRRLARRHLGEKIR